MKTSPMPQDSRMARCRSSRLLPPNLRRTFGAETVGWESSPAPMRRPRPAARMTDIMIESLREDLMMGVLIWSAKVNGCPVMKKAGHDHSVNYQRRRPSVRITSCVLPRRHEALRSNFNATESSNAVPTSRMLDRFQALRQLLLSPGLSFLMEAHNGLSAKIVEEAGFQGIWASGLSISASLGVRDNNEASWTQFLEVLEFMADATSLPILLDGDTGYGNFNSMRRLVRKLEQRGVAGVCIEDKLFPKTNSFIRGKAQPLAEIEEFCGKISAGKDAQLDDDFVIVARVEAFISGWGLAEA